MKNTLMALAVAAALVPGIASATTTKVVTQETVGPFTTTTTESTGIVGYIDKITKTVTKTVTKNARSDTEYHANDPNPGETRTDVQVSERIRYR